MRFRILKRIYANTFQQFGLDLRVAIASARGVAPFLRDYSAYNRMQRSQGGLKARIADAIPALQDRFKPNGELPRHYFHQDLWAARKVFNANPAKHVDIGSQVAGFVAHLLVFRPVEIVDIRPLPEKVEGLTVRLGDATDLAMYETGSLESVSSLHAAEHFGLGRYGDPIDPQAHIRFIKALTRVLKPEGRLYFSVPSGIERLHFNAHRVLAPSTILVAFDELSLVSFSCQLDDGSYLENVAPDAVAREHYGCGMYEFTKH